MRVTVIGAANVDILTKSADKIIHADSNPAVVNLSAGGVGLNIAVNLSRLGAEIDFVTAIGADPLGAFLRESCESSGINTSAWIVREGLSTGLYSAAHDYDGELYVGFNAMAVLESVEACDVALFGEQIRKADLLIVDANLTVEAIETILAERGDRPVMADTVSVAKAPRLGGLLPKIGILKLNRAEAQRLTGLAVDSDEDLKLACADLTSRGAGRVFITLGAQGVCAADSRGAVFVPAVPVAVNNVTGAGDAFAAGVAFRYNEDLETQAKYGAALAAQHLDRRIK